MSEAPTPEPEKEIKIPSLVLITYTSTALKAAKKNIDQYLQEYVRHSPLTLSTFPMTIGGEDSATIRAAVLDGKGAPPEILKEVVGKVVGDAKPGDPIKLYWVVSTIVTTSPLHISLYQDALSKLNMELTGGSEPVFLIRKID